MTPLFRLALCCAALALFGCNAIELHEPGPDAVFEPMDLELRWEERVVPGSVVVKLNGTHVAPQLALEVQPDGTTVATAEHLWGAGLVQNGVNEIEARVTIDDGIEVLRRWEVFVQGDPYADAVVSFTPGPGAGFGQAGLPQILLGPPIGEGPRSGSLDVVALGEGGSVILEFVDNVIVDGPGDDFTVFENAFFTTSFGFVTGTFAEPGRVSVSQDGVVWFEFACDDAPVDPPFYPGCAGVTPTLSSPLDPMTSHPSVPSVSTLAEIFGQPEEVLDDLEGAGGDSFDIGALGLAWAAFVRIEDVGPALGEVGTIGLDLDGAAAIHTIPFIDENDNDIPDAFEP